MLLILHDCTAGPGVSLANGSCHITNVSIEIIRTMCVHSVVKNHKRAEQVLKFGGRPQASDIMASILLCVAGPYAVVVRALLLS